jgi:hypothetical protein
MLTLPGIVEGNQQTSAHMVGDVITERLPILDGPTWPVSTNAGLGVTVNSDALAAATNAYARDGQFRPFQMSENRSEL